MFVVGSIEIVHTTLCTRIHDGKILIGKGDIDDDIGSGLCDEFGKFGYGVRIDLCSAYLNACSGFDILGDLLTLAYRTAGKGDLSKGFGIHRTFERYDITDTPGTDDEGFG
jgi:hypothetical protein